VRSCCSGSYRTTRPPSEAIERYQQQQRYELHSRLVWRCCATYLRSLDQRHHLRLPLASPLMREGPVSSGLKVGRSNREERGQSPHTTQCVCQRYQPSEYKLVLVQSQVPLQTAPRRSYILPSSLPSPRCHATHQDSHGRQLRCMCPHRDDYVMASAQSARGPVRNQF